MATHRAIVSAVVATYGRRDSLDRFLAALLENRDLHEVIVVVDGCHDGSLDVVEERAQGDDRVRGIMVDHQGQFGALDVGARAATGDIVLFLDDDVIVDEDFVRGHARAHRRDNLVVLGYMPTARPARASARDFATVLYAAEYEGRCRRYDEEPDTVLDHLWGGNFSVHRHDYQRLGPTQLVPPKELADVRLYHQDREFGFRCLDAGLSGHFDRSIRAVHEHQRGVDGFLRDAFGQGACNVLLAHAHPERMPDRGKSAAVESGGARSTEAHRATRRALDCAVASRSLQVALAAARATRRVEHRRGAAAMAQHLVVREAA